MADAVMCAENESASQLRAAKMGAGRR